MRIALRTLHAIVVVTFDDRDPAARRTLRVTSGDSATTGIFARESRIGIVATALAVAAMAVDHLLEEEGGFAADPPAFAIAVALSIVTAFVLFRVAIPRVLFRPDAADRAATVGLVLSMLALASLPLLFLGSTFVLGGAGFALGLVGRTGGHPSRATVAVAAGGAVVFVGVVAYTAVAIQKLV